MERLSSHTSSDDHKLYRSADEIEMLEKSDPIKVLEGALDRAKACITAEISKSSIARSKNAFAKNITDAEKAEDPSPNELELNVRGAAPRTR